MRLLGAGFLWISLTCLGVAYARKLKNRTALLENTKYLINRIKIETEFLHLPVQEILFKLTKASQLKSIDFIAEVCCLTEKGEDFPNAWKLAVEGTNLNYKIEEKEKLLQLGQSFGTSDIKNQIMMLEAYESYFDEFVSKAKNIYLKQAGSAGILGCLVGCMLFILLI